MIQQVKSAILALIGISAFLPIANAETVYVADTLRIGVRTDTSSDAASVTVITSGAQVEVIGQKGNMSQIRTDNGAEGWVKSAYLTNKKPTIVLLKEANDKIRKLENDIQALRTRQPTSSDDQQGTSMQIEQLEAEKARLQTELESLKDKAGLSTHDGSLLDVASKNNIIYWLIGSLVVILSVGFLFGVNWHKRQVMKRLGGLSL